MTGPFFVDTNILIYADDGAHLEKQKIARALIRSALREGTGKVSFQVLTEFFAAGTRKLGLAPPEVRRRVEIYSSLEVFRPGVADLLAAIDLHRLHQLSIWDALIVRAAQASGCRELYTEDLQHGQVFDGVEVRNPFTSSR